MSYAYSVSEQISTRYFVIDVCKKYKTCFRKFRQDASITESIGLALFYFYFTVVASAVLKKINLFLTK